MIIRAEHHIWISCSFQALIDLQKQGKPTKVEIIEDNQTGSKALRLVDLYLYHIVSVVQAKKHPGGDTWFDKDNKIYSAKMEQSPIWRKKPQRSITILSG